MSQRTGNLLAGRDGIENFDQGTEDQVSMFGMHIGSTSLERRLHPPVVGIGDDDPRTDADRQPFASSRLAGRALDGNIPVRLPSRDRTSPGAPHGMIRPTHALIDHAAVANNVRVIRSKIPPGTRVMAAVKADCYGHGSEACLPALIRAGVDMFGVATVEEGARLRRLGIENRIIVLSPPVEGQMAEFAIFGLEAMISNRRMADHLSQATSPGGEIGVHAFIDTGMGRDGARPEDTLELLRHLEQLDNLRIRGFASHFATSDEIDNSYASEQLACFEQLRQEMTGAGFSFEDVHIANSGGVFNLPTAHYTLVRPGIAIYGYHPTADLQQESGLEPVMTLRTEIANITQMPPGHSISYGRRYYTTAETSIATIPIGYGDGLMRSLTNRLSVLIAGKRFPVVGTICMDEVMIDLGADHRVSVGDEAILIGRSGAERIDAWELAAAIGTIPYEISTNLSARVPRIPTNERPEIPTPNQ